MTSRVQQLEQIIEPVANSFGCTLWGIDYRPFKKSALLRVYLDKVDGVTLDDCTNVSHQLSGLLDVEDPIQVPYTLEVSSPGLDRPLLKDSHYSDNVGKQIKLRLQRPIEGARSYTGEIMELKNATLKLLTEEKTVDIPLEAITRARLVVDTERLMKG